jgi:GNAT superfamily N-acetyltransferase
MVVTITQERPDTPEATALIDELEGILAPEYPPESRHGYSVAKLIAQGVAFFVLREDGAAAACGGVQLFGAEYGELKRMYVRPQYRGRGYAKRVMERLAAYALERGVGVLRLETGIHQREALELYAGWGFERIGPFGDYPDDPLSVHMEKRMAI